MLLNIYMPQLSKRDNSIWIMIHVYIVYWEWKLTEKKYFTTLYVFIFLLIESFVLHNYIEFNVSHSQQTTSIFLVEIGIKDLTFDMWLQSGRWFKQNFCIKLCTTYTLHLRELFLLINKVIE